MKFQLVINMERTSQASDMSEVARHTLEMVQMADAGGFESVWAAHHHALEIYIAPNPFQILTWWAAHTSRIRLGTGVVVAAYGHPISVAGEAALLDVYSGGRLELGIGSGAVQREFDRLRPGLEQSQGYRYVQEMLPAIKALWAGDHTHDGELWTFPATTSVPKPLQQPHPPIWVAARAPDTYEFAVRNRCNIMSWALTRPFSEVETYMQRFQSALESNPHLPRPIFSTMRYAAVVEEDEQLDDAVHAVHRRMAQLEKLRKNAGGVSNGFADANHWREIASREDFSRAELVRNLMFGTPRQVIAKLRQYQELGVDQFTYCASFGLGMAAQQRSLELFISEVMPEFDEIHAVSGQHAR